MRNLLFGLLLGSVAFTAFFGGIEYSRTRIKNLANEMARHPTNSFTACLTEMWALSGELDGDWKGDRGWKLVDKGDTR